MDLSVKAIGDLHVDFHHTVEDTGIVLGQALREALGDKRGIVRYGSAYLPMDETLARVAVDLSGRSFLEFRAPASVPAIGLFPFQLVEEFLRGFAHNILANVHVEILYGRDAHHMAEAVFKGLARALDGAMRIDPRVPGVPSTKESL
jgi:imidazoleglycerol-phosphate dehydratase